jgi:hypothetical protein
MAQNFCAFFMLSNGKLSCSILPSSSILAIAHPFPVFFRHSIIGLWLIVGRYRRERWKGSCYRLPFVFNALVVFPDYAHGS